MAATRPRPPRAARQAGQGSVGGGAEVGGQRRAGEGRHARLRPGGRLRQPVGAVPDIVRHELPRHLQGDQRSAVLGGPGRRRRCGYLVESVEPNADYTEWTLKHPRRHQVPRRHAARWRGRQVQHRVVPVQPVDRDRSFVTIDKVTASGQDVVITTKGPWVALPSAFWTTTRVRSCSRRPGSAASKTSRSATEGRRSTTPRWPRPRPMAIRPSRSGSARSRSSRIPPATATSSSRSATTTTGAGRTASRTRTCRTSTGSTSSSPSTRTAGRTRSRSGEFDLMMTANGDTISQFLDDDAFKVDSSTKFGDTALHHAEHGHRRSRPGGHERRQPAAQRRLPQGPGPGDRPRALGRGAERRPRPAGQRTVPAGLHRLPGGQRLPAVRRRRGASRDGQVPVGVEDGSHRVHASTRRTTRSTWSRTR